MHITVQCFATLDKYAPQGGELDVEEGETVLSVMQRLGVPRDEVKIIFINGRHVTDDTTLKEKDRLGLFPAVGGG